MSYCLTYEQRPSYLYVLVNGDNSLEAVMRYMADIAEECQQRDVTRVLIDDQLEGPRLQTSDVFSIAAEGSTNGLGLFDAIAYVDKDMGEMGEFAETVAVNRGMPVAIFSDVDSADRWLCNRSISTDDTGVFMDENR